MKLLLASTNPFDVKAALLAGHTQHPVIVHFPIALFFASVLFEILAISRRQPTLSAVAYYNLLGAALSLPFVIATGLGAWHWQLEGAAMKGNREQADDFYSRAEKNIPFPDANLLFSWGLTREALGNRAGALDRNILGVHRRDQCDVAVVGGNATAGMVVRNIVAA